jgi:thiamine phosphate synthase YjbQ (UPF0047 family)
MNDFTKFVCFVKGVIETGVVIKNSDKTLRQDVKMHFNRLLNDALQFEKYLHKELGPDVSEAEDDINSMIISLVWQIFDMPREECNKFFEHLNRFNDSVD